MGDKIKLITTLPKRMQKETGLDLKSFDIYRSDGLLTHVVKRHPDYMQYMLVLKDIIENPDYIGNNPKENGSFELVKVFSDNIQIGIKLDVKDNYLYVATLHEITDAKLKRRLQTGRLKSVD